MSGVPRAWLWGALLTAILLPCCGLAAAQSRLGPAKRLHRRLPVRWSANFLPPFAMRHEEVSGVCSEGGVNFGPQVQHVTRGDVEQQLLSHRGLYCQLFDSSCIDAAIKLDASERACSYRELLAHSLVRTAATETTRNGVRQAILVAEVKNDQCPSERLVDFIFNFEAAAGSYFRFLSGSRRFLPLKPSRGLFVISHIEVPASGTPP